MLKPIRRKPPTTNDLHPIHALRRSRDFFATSSEISLGWRTFGRDLGQGSSANLVFHPFPRPAVLGVTSNGAPSIRKNWASFADSASFCF